IGAGEELLVGQHRETGGAAAGVAAGDPRRIEALADDALAGRGLLHFGDHGRLTLVDAARQGRGEGARRRRVGDSGADLGERQPGTARLDFTDLVFEDAPEDIRRGSDVHGHRARKFFSSRWPCWVRMDSGWNCTPYTGCS